MSAPSIRVCRSQCAVSAPRSLVAQVGMGACRHRSGGRSWELGQTQGNAATVLSILRADWPGRVCYLHGRRRRPYRMERTSVVCLL